MRLFTAIDLPDDVLGNLVALLERLKPAARIKWSPPCEPAHHHQVHRRVAGGRLPELTAALGRAARARRLSRFRSADSVLSKSALAARVLGRRRGAAGLAALAARHRPRAGGARRRARKARLLAAPDPGAHQGAASDSRRCGRSIAASIRSSSALSGRPLLSLPEQARAAGSVYTKLSEFPFYKQ